MATGPRPGPASSDCVKPRPASGDTPSTSNTLPLTISPVTSCGLFTGSVSSMTFFATEKMAVLAPMPSAREVTAMAVNPGLLRRRRAANRRSAQNSSHQRRPSAARMPSLCVTVPPSVMRARRVASSGSYPLRANSAINISRWESSSVFISNSNRSRPATALTQARPRETNR